MKIVRLEAENVKRLKAVRITPDGNPVVIIGGKNGQGKTTALDCIDYAFHGKGSICDEPVRHGEKAGWVTCELDGKEKLVVNRTMTPKGGGQLTVTNADGAEYPTPQTMLNKLYSEYTFDPLAFKDLKSIQQLDRLKEIVGLDFSKPDADRQGFYDKRTIINRDAKALDAQLVALPKHDDAPADEVSVSALIQELSDAEAVNYANSKVRNHAGQVSGQCQNIRDQIEDLQTALKQKEEELAQWQAKVKKLANNIDLETIKKQVSDAETINQAVRENQTRAKLQKSLADAEKESESLTAQIESIDSGKQKAMADAKFPIEGLSFDEKGVRFKGTLFSECSSAEKLRVCVAMGLALNPELKVLLIRNGSLLDEDSLRLVAQLAEENDAQVWIERVGEGAECQVIIEDGAVQGKEVRENVTA